VAVEVVEETEETEKEEEEEETEKVAAEIETATGNTSKIPTRRKRAKMLSLYANRRGLTSQTLTTSPPSDADCPFKAF
jgi:hypothetical protein